LINIASYLKNTKETKISWLAIEIKNDIGINKNVIKMLLEQNDVPY